MSRIKELQEKLKIWREAYYNLDPIVPDDVYDAAKDELASLDPKNTEVTAVGASAPNGSIWEKVRHEIPMGSLAKVNSWEEFVEWTKPVESQEFFFTHKLDGSSMELVYVNGELKRCVTRGDGIIGEDVTANVSKVPNIPKTLQGFSATIRGEIIMEKAVFKEKYSEEYANPRNTAAAKVREKKNSGADCENLKFYAYWMDSNDKPTTYRNMMHSLRRLGFNVPEFEVGDVQAMRAEFEKTKENRLSIPYEIDGVVVSVNDLVKLDEMGSQNMRPLGQIAWKFDAAKRETRIRSVKWQVGPSGRITPVAVVDPVNIGGVVITNISLHNMWLFRDLNLHEGDRVLVSRRNDVIPYIERNLEMEEAA